MLNHITRSDLRGPLESDMTGAENPTMENSKKRQRCDSQHDSSTGEVGAGGGQVQNSSNPDALVKHNSKKKGKSIYPYGNYNHYYNYRVARTLDVDPRMTVMQKIWFEDKDVFDIGCNEGHVTISLVQKYQVRSMCGVDIDPGLINKAWKNLYYESGVPEKDAPQSLYEWSDYVHERGEPDDDDEDCRNGVTGDESQVSTSDADIGLQGKELLERVIFKNANILRCDLRRNMLDTVLCLSVAKWIHLNWGDEGLIQFFIKIYRILRQGGVLILEPQPWSSYARNYKVSEVCRQNYKKLVIRPDHFQGILLEKIGFKSCEQITLEVPGSTKGFSRPVYLYTK